MVFNEGSKNTPLKKMTSSPRPFTRTFGTALALMLPIVRDLGIDPIQFAAIIGVNLGMGNITPPTAPPLYLGARIGNTSVNSMLKPTLVMILFAWIPTLLLTTYIPEVALALPNLVYGR